MMSNERELLTNDDYQQPPPSNLSEYQAWTRSTAIYPGAGTGNDDEVNYLVLGLCSEAGEVAGVRKKLLRARTNPSPEGDEGNAHSLLYVGKMVEELGDCLYYLARLAEALDVDLYDILRSNYYKLENRKAAGSLHERKKLPGKHAK